MSSPPCIGRDAPPPRNDPQEPPIPGEPDGAQFSMLCIACSAALHLPGPAPVHRPWHFDLTSALIGAAVALLLVVLAYRSREALRLGWEAAMEPLAQLRRRVQTSAEDRYREQVATWARSLTVPATTVSVDPIIVEPQLIPPTPLPQSLPQVRPVHGIPQLLPPERTLGGHPCLAIVGPSGAGKTTLLATFARACTHPTGGREDHTETEALPASLRGRVPLYVLLPAMDWDTVNGASEQESDGTGRLLHAAVAAVGGSGGQIRALRPHLEAGRAIVLADGWDQLSLQQQQQATEWLARLARTLPGNLWLICAGSRGYGPLTEAGFVPLRVAMWSARQIETFAERWVNAHPPADEPVPAALRRLVVALSHAAQAGAPPLELALQTPAVLADGGTPEGRVALFDRALDSLLEQERPEVSGPGRAALQRVAVTLQQEGRVTASQEEIKEAIESALPPSEESPSRKVNQVFRALTGLRGLLIPASAGCYAFAHPLLQAHLVASQLPTSVEPANLIERLDDPRWAEVLRCYAEVGDMGPLVAAWLRRPDDLSRWRLHTLGSWVRAASPDAAWRHEAMAALARGFLQPDLPIQVRQALAETIATTGVQGITYFFKKQASQHPDAEVRTAAVLGLARAAGEADLAALEDALKDEDARVRAAVVRGLGMMGIDAATHWLARILMSGDDTLSPIAAQALAECGDEGMLFLRQAVESEDVIARRAAVFGLAQARAQELLQKVAREDEQWIVRSAAAAAVDELEMQEKIIGVPPPPEIEQLPWLISWAGALGEGMGVGEAAREMLWQALHEGDAQVRQAAAQVLAQAGRPADVEPLRTALDDPDPTVASAAWEALAEISKRYDLSEP